MGFEFLADMALGPNEAAIDDVVHHRAQYTCLQQTPWTVKAQVLSTGFAIQDSDYVSALKNGRAKDDKRKGLVKRNGYPGLFKKNVRSPLSDPWRNLFLPNSQHVLLLPPASCLLKFDLKLTAPFFSRDDTSLYPTENPLKREWVFKAPYLGAAGIKGLLRWAWQMCWQDNRMEQEILIFGPRQGDLKDDQGQQGLLYAYPLFWDGEIGLDIINPHERDTNVGTNPIKYEVVKKHAVASLYLMLINRQADPAAMQTALNDLTDPLRYLLNHTGLSAKRSAGWGTVDVTDCSGWLNVPAGVAAAAPAASGSEKDEWEGLVDENGQLMDIEETQIFTTNVISRLSDMSKSQVKKNRDQAKQIIVEKWKALQATVQEKSTQSPDAIELLACQGASIGEMMAALQNNLSAAADMLPQEDRS